jgi:hypothetical protein
VTAVARSVGNLAAPCIQQPRHRVSGHAHRAACSARALRRRLSSTAPRRAGWSGPRWHAACRVHPAGATAVTADQVGPAMRSMRACRVHRGIQQQRGRRRAPGAGRRRPSTAGSRTRT